MSGGIIGSETEIPFRQTRPAAGAEDFTGLQARRGNGANHVDAQVAERHGPPAAEEANLSRGALFRRSLLAADLVAIVGAFVLLAQARPRGRCSSPG